MALNVEFNHQSKRVKVTPGTTMFQVLESAREHFGLGETRQYQLLHRNKPIDLSIPFRLTGISNNAAVELKELEGVLEVQQVRVCVQLRDGKRVQASFGNDTTIESILIFFKLLPASQNFLLGFLRREIQFDSFATTTLKDLGILSGSAMFRVQTADGILASEVPNTQSAPVQKPRVSFAAPTAPPPAPVSEPSQSVPVPQEVEDEEMKEATEEPADVAFEEEKVEAPRMDSHSALQLLRDGSFDAVSRGAITTLMKIVTNILSHPDNEKMRSIRLSNAAFNRSVGQVKGGLEFLQSVGFVVVHETQILTLGSVKDCKKMLEEGLRLLYIEADDLSIARETRPVVVEEKPADPSFDVFKTQITRMQMQPRGPSTTEVLVDALKTKQDQLTGHEKPPRNTTVSLAGRRVGARIDSSHADSSENEPSDSQLLISSLKARRQEMEKAKNFRTQAMRDLDDLKRKKVFQSALIRVQFPDRAIMQAAFHPSETIQDVMNHVKECLASAYADHPFFLYVTPPTQKLAPEKTLADLNLVPAALTYLSWLEVPPQPEQTAVGFYFRPDLVAEENAESKERANPLESVEYPKPLTLENPQASVAKSDAQAETKQQPPAAKTTSRKKPSWLKL